MILLELLLEFMMMMDIPDWGWVSLMMFWIVSICSEEAMFEIWLKSVEFKGIKNPFKD